MEVDEKLSKIRKLKGEIDDIRLEQSSAISKANSAVDRFNCYARGSHTAHDKHVPDIRLHRR